MFKRLTYEEWQTIVPIIAFVLTFSVFLFQVIRAVRIKKPQSEHLASLPLEDERNQAPNSADHERES